MRANRENSNGRIYRSNSLLTLKVMYFGKYFNKILLRLKFELRYFPFLLCIGRRAIGFEQDFLR